VKGQRPLLIAHAYGNRRHLLLAALAAGVDMVEVDGWCRGGRLWARHERRLGPLPLLFDWRRHARHGLGPWALPLGRAYLRLDLRPLPLEEVAAMTRGRCRLLLDVKGQGSPAYVRAYLAALERLLAGADPGQLVLCGQEWAVLDAARQALPHLPVRYSLETPQQWQRLWPRLRDGLPPHGLCLHWSLVEPQRAAQLSELGIGFYVWTVNSPAQARRALELGAEGVISDRLDLLSSLPLAAGGAQG
jgi:glycerophosphoryl diester phosphodiesterase